jgi:hypothetical protein
MNQTNGNRRGFSLTDVIEDDPQPEGTTSSFYDPENPVFAPAKEVDTTRKKSWKRKLIGWGFVLLSLGGGGFALYSLLKINRVNVRVQADSRRDGLNARPTPSPGSTENGLSAEAINIAREAIGADPNQPKASASPGASPVPSPSPGARSQVNYSSTLNTVLGPTNDPGTTTSNPNQANPNQAKQESQQVSKGGTNSESELVTQSRANPTQSIFVDDSPPKPVTTARESARPTRRPDTKATPSSARVPSAVLPPFGTMLPVRTQGVIFTLRNNSYARLELMRDVQGEGWSLPKGTVLVGRVSGSEYDRAFVNVIGFVDPRENRFVKLTGEVLGSDGASGIQGKQVVVDRNRLKDTLRKVASSGLQVAGMAAGALTGRGTVVVNGAGYRVLNPVTDEAGRMVGGGDEKRSFVKVEAGSSGYVMVADLPKELHAVDAPGEDELTRAAMSMTGSLSDREVMELILFGTPEEIRAALPLMNDEQKQMALKTLKPENEK